MIALALLSLVTTPLAAAPDCLRPWWPDGDGDGYGAVGASTLACPEDAPEGSVARPGDCDDDSAYTYPGATELCDGVRNDCADPAWAGDAGRVSFAANADGAWRDETAACAAGADASPASVTLAEAGTWRVCPGTFYVNLRAEADVTVEGLRGAATTHLRGGGAGPVVEVALDGVSVDLVRLTLADGGGATTSVGGASYLAGGGLLCAVDAEVRLDDVALRESEAQLGGGAALTGGCQATFTGATLAHNHASDAGGGLYLRGADAILIDSAALANSAGAGGGAPLDGRARLTHRGFNIAANEAEYGGAIAADNAELHASNGAFEFNGASGSGGALYLTMAADAALSDVTIADNSASSGGAIHGYVSALEMEGGDISDNIAESGGAIYLYTADVTLTDVAVTGNRAAYGGAMALLSQGEVVMGGGSIEDNEASALGGGLYLYDYSYATLSGTALADNSAAQGGGALLIQGGTLIAEESAITGNTADYVGGGVYATSGGWLTLGGGSMTDNTAGRAGGGLYLRDGSRAWATACDVLDNSPQDVSVPGVLGGYDWGPGATFTCDDAGCY